MNDKTTMYTYHHNVRPTNNKLIFLLKDVASLMVATIPILQHYNGIGANPALVTTIICAIIAMIKLATKKVVIYKSYLLLVLYGLYASFIHGINAIYFLREMVQLIVYLSVINGLFDIPRLIKCYRLIAMAATGLIIIQYICYYIFGFHLQLVSIRLLNPNNVQWFDLVRTGLIGVTGGRLSFYRPSAFFLEPSHFAIYCIPPIVMTLFSTSADNKADLKKALFISVGVLLSTSGMGIAVVMGCWIAFLIFYIYQKGEERRLRLLDLLKVRSQGILLLLVVLFFIAFFTVPFFRNSVMRIFVAESGSNYSAIQGRTTTGIRSLSMLKGIRLLIGFGDIYDISNWNMTAFFFVTFRFGLIGTIIFYSFYLYSLRHLKKEESFWMTVVFILLSVFTVHMFGAYFKMYYTMLILYGYEKELRRRNENWMY